jgi:hypothetical protein
MAAFEKPDDLVHNRGLVTDPEAFAAEAGAASWEVLARAEADGALFCKVDEYKAWVANGLAELGDQP